jgi:hypothetical protein
MRRGVAIVRPLELASGRTRSGRAAAVALSGLGIALVALTGFGLAHALIIIPIWTRLVGGVPFAALAGIALAWAFDVLAQQRASASIGTGVQFGAVMYLTLLPATAFETAMRWAGLRTLDWTETIPAVALSLVSGAIAGRLLTGEGRHEGLRYASRPHEARREPLIAFAVAALALMFASAGPLPVAQSTRGAWLSLAIAPICLAAGAALAFLQAQLRIQDHP